MLGKSRFGFGLFAPRVYEKGDLIYEYESEVVSKGADLRWEVDGKSIPLSVERHTCRCEGGWEWTGLDAFINHSCRPNTYYEGQKLISLRRIEEGEELLVHYDTVDWVEDYPYMCECGEEECLGLRRGFKFLPAELKEEFIRRGWVSSYVLKMYSERGQDRQGGEKSVCERGDRVQAV